MALGRGATGTKAALSQAQKLFHSLRVMTTTEE